MSIHDAARRLSAQTGMALTRAYSSLSRRRRKHYGKTTVQPGAFTAVERPANYRLPYADN